MLVPKLGRKHISAQVALAAVYLLLAAGSAIIIYPFAVMFGSATSTIEHDRFYPLPVFLWDDSALLGKYLHEKYVGPFSTLANLGAKYAMPIESASDLEGVMLEGDLLRDAYGGMRPEDQRWREAARRRVQDWMDFKRTLPIEFADVYFCNESFASSSKVKAGLLKFLRHKYARSIERQYAGDVHRLNAERGFRLKSVEELERRDRVIADEISRVYHIHVGSLQDVQIPHELLGSHAWLPEDSPRMSDWLDYKRTLPAEQVQVLCLSQLYQDFLARKYSLGLFNFLYGWNHKTFREVVFRSRRLATAGEISDWNDFLRVVEDLSAVRLIVNPATRLQYERMLRERFGTIEKYNARFSGGKKAFFEVELASRRPAEPTRAALWERFVRESAPRHLLVPIPDRACHEQALRSEYTAELQRKYLSVENLNRKTGKTYMTFEEAYDQEKATQLLIEKLMGQYGSLREYNAANNTAWQSWQETVLPNPLRRAWQEFLSEKYGELALANAAHGRDYASLPEIPLPAILPDHDIVEFVKTALPLRLVALQDNAENRRLWYDYLRKSFDGSVDKLSAAMGKHYVTFEEVPFYYALPREKAIRSLWIELVEGVLPFESIRFQDPEANFRLYLREKFGTLERLNAAHGTSYSTFEEVRPPYKEVDLLEFYEKKGTIRMAFLWKNVVAVIRLAVLQGRALFNTTILCVLSVAGVLIVNPLAAYALSRFRRVFSHHLHFFLLATAAFPAILTMVPNFLLLRTLGLLNTYWAIVLPTMASGLGILILKSYFDRIPLELYDAARLDGAGELRTFAHVCLPLSKPILATVALQAFVITYGRFMWPLLTCQKEKMWPLTVWLYQLEVRHGGDFPQLVMAGILVTAIPLVIVFMLCQRAMFRGVRLPAFR